MPQWQVKLGKRFVTHTVGTNVSLVDGRVSPYDTVRPGDTLLFSAGTHVPITIKNIQGTLERPIRIINSGLVEFTSLASEHTVTFNNSRHFRLTGTGADGIDYGFKFTDYYTIGIIANCKTDNLEIDHVEMYERHCSSPSYGIGIHILTYGLPQEYANSWNWDAYDYNGDSVLEGVDGRFYTVENVEIHDCRFDGTEGVRNFDMGMYLGHGNYTENPENRSLYDASHVLQTVPCWFPPISNLNVYNCNFAHTNRKCIKIGGVIGGGSVHDNVMNDVCAQTDLHVGAIDINPGCTDIDVYNNRAIDLNNGLGLYSFGEEVRIFNNLFVNPGYYGMVVEALRPAGYHHYKSNWIMNNTVVSTYNAACVAFSALEGTDERVQNNILVNSNGAYYDKPAGGTVTYNYTNTNVANAGFTDYANDDYSLTSGSTCRNSGTDLTAYGVVDDIVGTPRPKGSVYDRGAYEYNE